MPSGDARGDACSPGHAGAHVQGAGASRGIRVPVTDARLVIVVPAVEVEEQQRPGRRQRDVQRHRRQRGAVDRRDKRQWPVTLPGRPFRRIRQPRVPAQHPDRPVTARRMTEDGCRPQQPQPAVGNLRRQMPPRDLSDQLAIRHHPIIHPGAPAMPRS